MGHSLKRILKIKLSSFEEMFALASEAVAEGSSYESFILAGYLVSAVFFIMTLRFDFSVHVNIFSLVFLSPAV